MSVTGYRGKSVVDYHIARQEDMKHISNFAVQSCTALVAMKNWQYLLSDICHLPDHNILTMDLEIGITQREQLVDCNLGSKAVDQK